MHLPDVRIFAMVASGRSLSAAARRLGITPMQVSRRIAALEEELSTRLLHRTTRSVSLTPEGEAFLPYALVILDAEESARSELGQERSAVRGHLKLTAPSVFGQEVILPLLTALLRQHPELKVELDLSDRVFDIVASGYDLAIRIATLKDSDLVARRLAAHRRVLCASPEYLADRGVPRKLADLDHHDCILLAPLGKWPFVIDGELHRVPLSGRLTTTSVEAVRAVALSGCGVAMLARWDVRQHLLSGRLVELTLEDASTEQLSIWAVTPTRRYVPPRVKVFLDALELALSGD
jgi:DNA-binding transcriptional LysR family regulator